MSVHPQGLNTLRIKTLFKGQKPDRIPLVGLNVAGGGFSMINCGFTLKEMQIDPKKTLEAEVWTHEQYDWDLLIPEPSHTVYGSWDFGATMKMPEDEYSFAVTPVAFGINTEEDIECLTPPNPHISGAIPLRMELASLCRDAHLPIGFNSRSPFNLAADMCPIENFAKWLIKKPNLCERMIETALEHLFNVMKVFTEAFGPEKIIVGLSSPSESNQLFSPRIFESLALPAHREYQRKLKALGLKQFVFHICGDQNMNFPFLSEFAAGPDGWQHPSILSFGHEIDILEAARYFPEDVIMGNLDTSVIQFGHPQKIYDLCADLLEKGKKVDAGFILAPGCDLPPRAPAHNVWAMTKAVNTFGWLS